MIIAWQVDDAEDVQCIASAMASGSLTDFAAPGTTVDVDGNQIQVCSFTPLRAGQCQRRILVSGSLFDSCTFSIVV